MMEESLNEIDKDKYSIIKMDGIYNYKCGFCDFATIYKNSLIRHFNKKNLCNKRNEYKCETCNKIFNQKQNLMNHMNKKNKCNIDVKEDVKEDVMMEDLKEDLIGNTNDSNKVEILLEREKEIIDLKGEIERLRELFEEREIENKKKYDIFYDRMSDDIIEIMDSKRFPSALRKGIYLNKVEYIILHGSLTRHRCNVNEENIRRRVFALMEIISDNLFDKFMEDVRTDYQDLIPFIRDFQDYLKGLDTKKKVNNMNVLTYYDIINIKLGTRN